MKITFWLTIALFAALGCDGGSTGSGRPDTGVGANQPVPATENCVDLCNRVATCTTELCDEDTKSTQFDGLASLLAQECMSGCTDAAVQSSISTANWQCTFQKSCRQVLDDQECGSANYHCS